MKLTSQVKLGSCVINTPQQEGGFDLSDYKPNVAIASFRRINSEYTGDLIRIRRASDNVEQSFGAGVGLGEFVDASEIATFLGGTTVGLGYITRIFDQSGNSFHFRQTSASRQPMYIHPGALGFGATVPCAFFDGNNDLLQADTITGRVGGYTSRQTTFIVSLSTSFNFEALAAAGDNPTINNGLREYRLIRQSTLTRFAYYKNVNEPSISTTSPITNAEVYMLNANRNNIVFSKDNSVSDSKTYLVDTSFSPVRYINLMSGSATSWAKQGIFNEYILIDSSLGTDDQDAVFTNLLDTYV
jgi:hypothetical protein